VHIIEFILAPKKCGFIVGNREVLEGRGAHYYPDPEKVAFLLSVMTTENKNRALITRYSLLLFVKEMNELVGRYFHPLLSSHFIRRDLARMWGIFRKLRGVLLREIIRGGIRSCPRDRSRKLLQRSNSYDLSKMGL
jgi:hypothetical protein